MSKKFENIEVAVRLRPLNQQEQTVDAELAWDIKARLAGGIRRSMEFLANGQGRELQLKNKHRFGIGNQDKSPVAQTVRSKSIPIYKSVRKNSYCTPTPRQDFSAYKSQNGRVSEFKLPALQRANSANKIEFKNRTAQKTLTARKQNFRNKSAMTFKNGSSNSKIFTNRSKSAMKEPSSQQLQHKYDFDLIYGDQDTNRDVYEQTVRKVVLSSMDGLNGTVFVYGQTGTGKTYTMMGNQRTRAPQQEVSASMQKNLYDTYENSGVLIFSMQDLFDKINQLQTENLQFNMKLSYIEIYNENIFDLLEENKRQIHEKILSIHEGKNKQFVVNGANEIPVSTIQEVLNLIQYGEKNRHYAETHLNHCSSRSHTLFRLHLTKFQKNQMGKFMETNSYLNFVDLAGSEKITNYYGRENGHQSTRLKEGLSINKSLFYLTQVIHILSQRVSRHVPYRNSALTKILKSSLSGNSRTSIIVCITPASSQIEQTINSLKFGEKAMKVQQNARAEVQEMRNNAIAKRQPNTAVREVVFEYEAKIKQLQEQEDINRKRQEDRIEQLIQEKERLTKALEKHCDRSYFTKIMYTQQKEGQETITLKYAGDVCIQGADSASHSLSNFFQKRKDKLNELDLLAYNCKKASRQFGQQNQMLINENTELKEECDRLEHAYSDIISQFTKMSNIQDEILKMASHRDKQENLEDMTDRELKTHESSIQLKIQKIKEQKEKRQKHRKVEESASKLSSERTKIQNFIKSNICSTSNKKHSARSLDSHNSQGFDSGRKPHIQKFLNSAREYNDSEKESTFGNNKVPLLNFGGIHIDKSLYIQEKGMDYQQLSHRVKDKIQTERDSYRRPSNSYRSQGEYDQHIEAQMAQQEQETYRALQEIEQQPIPFTDVVQPWNQHQFEIIKEEVLNENNPSSFDNLSNSRGFNMSSQGLSAIPKGSQNSSQHLQDIYIDLKKQCGETPKNRMLNIQPQMMADKIFEELSMDHYQTQKSAQDKMMSEELFMEFQMDQEIQRELENQQIEIKEPKQAKQTRIISNQRQIKPEKKVVKKSPIQSSRSPIQKLPVRKSPIQSQNKKLSLKKSPMQSKSPVQKLPVRKSPLQTSKSPSYKIPSRKSPLPIKPLTKSSSRKSVSPKLEIMTKRLTMSKPSLQKSRPVSNQSSARKSEFKKGDSCTVLQTSISQENRVLHVSREYENPEINLSRVYPKKLKQISIDLTDTQEEDDAYLAHIAPKPSADSSMITPYGLIEINDLSEDSIIHEQEQRVQSKTPFAEQKNVFFSSNDKLDTGVFKSLVSQESPQMKLDKPDLKVYITNKSKSDMVSENSQTVSGSNSRSFKPIMEKEKYQLEETQRQLYEHNVQYKDIFKEILGYEPENFRVSLSSKPQDNSRISNISTHHDNSVSTPGQNISGAYRSSMDSFQKSHGSDKIANLQREYERIKQQRKSLMDSMRVSPKPNNRDSLLEPIKLQKRYPR